MKHRKKSTGKKPHPRASLPAESQVANSVTVAWTVSVTTVLMCDVVAALAHFYAQANPTAVKIGLLSEMLLFGGCLVGLLSLVLIPVMYRVRQLAPPRGLVVFGALAAVAPILAMLARMLR